MANVEITGGGTITCTNPSVTLTASTNANQISWTGPNDFVSNQATISVSTAGTYTVNVTTAAGCTASSSITIQGDSAIPGVTATGGTLTCTNTSVQLTATSTVDGVTFSWSGPNGFSSNDANPTVSQGGTYSVTVATGAGCTATESVLVTEDIVDPIVEVTGGVISCATGSVVLGVQTNGTVIGWTGPNGFGTSTANPTVMDVGNYVVTVVGANGCETTATAQVTGQGAVINIEVVSTTNASCAFGANGSAQVSATGGQAPYTYQWNDPDNQTTALAVNLPAGTFTVTATDSNGCSQTITVTIGEDNDCTAALGDQTFIDANRNGLFDQGEPVLPGVVVTLLDGMGNVIDVTVTDNNGMYMFSGLRPGQYIVRFETPDGFQVTLPNRGDDEIDSDINMVTLESPLINLGVNEQDKSIDAGFFQTASVGDFVWIDYDCDGIQDMEEPGIADVEVQIKNLEGTVLARTITDDDGFYGFSNFIPGDYSIMVVLPDGFTFTAPNQGNGTNDSDIDPVTGMTPPFSLASGESRSEFDAGLKGMIDIALDKQVNRSVVAVGESVMFTITAVNEGDALATGVQITDPVPDGFTNISAITNGGVLSGTTITWSDIDLDIGESITLTFNAVVAGNSESYTNVAQVTAADQEDADSTPNNDDGDQSEDDEDVASLVVSGCDLSVSVTTQNAICTADNGMAQVMATGGVAPFTYDWSTGDVTATVSNLPVGIVTVTITDATGCSATIEIEIEQDMSDINVDVDVNNITCGTTDGQATVTATGGTAPYTYAWSTGDVTATVSNLPAGVFTVTVTDANGCVGTDEIEVRFDDNNLGLSVVSTQRESCDPGNDGIGEVMATGGVQPFTYIWSNGFNGPRQTGLSSGVFTVEVTDGNQCTATTTVVIEQAAGCPDDGCDLSLAIVDLQIESCGNGVPLSNGIGEVVAVDGSAPFTYIWSNGFNGPRQTGLQAGTFFIDVVDNEGCTASISLVIGQQPNCMTDGGDTDGGDTDGGDTVLTVATLTVETLTVEILVVETLTVEILVMMTCL